MTTLTRRLSTLAVTGALTFGGFASAAGAAPSHDAAAASHAAPAVKLPHSFPTPAHSALIKKQKKNGLREFVFAVKSQKSAYRFWKRELPKKGWTIRRAGNNDGGKEILMKGHGFSHDTGIVINGKRAAVIFDKTG
jgi:hypothetical protein